MQDGAGGKTAENWSRKDRIRGGAVTGPWRSAPRVESGGPAVAAVPHAPLDDTPQAPRPHPPRDGRHLYAVGSAPAAAAHPTPAPHAPVHTTRPDRHPVPQPKRGRGLGGMIAWTLFGIVFAAGCVVIAFLFQPEPPTAGMPATIDVLGDPNGPAEAPAAPVKAAVAPVVPSAVLAGIASVRLRIGPDFPADRRDEIVAALDRAGLADVQVEALPFKVATSRVGYYRAADKSAAEALAGAIGPTLGETIGIRDYGQLSPPPEVGRLDLWVD